MIHEGASSEDARKSLICNIWATSKGETRKTRAKAAHSDEAFACDARVSVKAKGGERLVKQKSEMVIIQDTFVA